MRHIQHAHSHRHRFKAAINKNYDYYDGIECNEREKKWLKNSQMSILPGTWYIFLLLLLYSQSSWFAWRSERKINKNSAIAGKTWFLFFFSFFLFLPSSTADYYSLHTILSQEEHSFLLVSFSLETQKPQSSSECRAKVCSLSLS